MRTISAILAVMILFGFSLVENAYAQTVMKWKGSGGWGAGSQYTRMYNPKSVETISGEVASIDEITPIRGMYHGIHITVETTRETISVHLGPSWFIENLDVKIEPKDKLEIKGSRVSFDGKPVIIASEIKKDDAILKLRDESGFPFWAGWRKK